MYWTEPSRDVLLSLVSLQVYDSISLKTSKILLVFTWNIPYQSLNNAYNLSVLSHHSNRLLSIKNHHWNKWPAFSRIIMLFRLKKNDALHLSSCYHHSFWRGHMKIFKIVIQALATAAIFMSDDNSNCAWKFKEKKKDTFKEVVFIFNQASVETHDVVHASQIFYHYLYLNLLITIPY